MLLTEQLNNSQINYLLPRGYTHNELIHANEMSDSIKGKELLD
jgi:hypothetical protein